MPMREAMPIMAARPLSSSTSFLSGPAPGASMLDMYVMTEPPTMSAITGQGPADNAQISEGSTGIQLIIDKGL